MPKLSAITQLKRQRESLKKQIAELRAGAEAKEKELDWLDRNIIKELGLSVGNGFSRLNGTGPAIRPVIGTSRKPRRGRPRGKAATATLQAEGKKVLAALDKKAGKGRKDIAKATGLDPDRVTTLLSRLQGEKKARKTGTRAVAKWFAA